jgi:hypothetical protein
MEQRNEGANGLQEARREFLAKCGKLAIATPPAVTLMLAASERHYAVAQSAGGGGGARRRQGNNGFGNGGGDGVPGRSGQNNSPQASSKAADQNR